MFCRSCAVHLPRVCLILRQVICEVATTRASGPRRLHALALTFSNRLFLHVQAQVSGPIPADFPVEFRADSGLQYRNIGVDGSEGVVSKYRPQYSLPSFNETTDLSGGFYEDGPWGPVKLTKSNALTTSNLAWAMLDLPGPYERDPEKMVCTSLPSCVFLYTLPKMHWLFVCILKLPCSMGLRQDCLTAG